MNDEDDDIDEFEAALTSGDTDAVNRAINLVGDLSQVERATLFDEGIAMCSTLSEAADGYTRQAAVRFAERLHPRLAYAGLGHDRPDDALPGDWTIADAAEQRQRLADLFLDGLADEDGRVRKAAVLGLREISSCAARAGAADELERMLDRIGKLEVDAEGSALKHVREASRTVERQRSICE